MSDNQEPDDRYTLNMMYGTYADVLFVLFPFLVIALQGVWAGELTEVLLRPDLSIAASIIGGLAIGKFVMGLISDRDLGRYKERIVFFIAATLFAVLGPSMLMILLILVSDDLPGFLAFVQPILLIVAISLYTTAVSISNVLTGGRSRRRQAEQADDSPEAEEPLEELELPHQESTRDDRAG